MSFSIGIPNATGVSISGKSAAAIRELSDATAAAATQALGTKQSEDKPVKTGPVGLAKSADAQADAQAGDSTSVAVKVLLKRLKELQEQMRQQQQQLAAAQVASYPTPEAKTTVISAIQGQVAQTSGAILQVSASLAKELSKGSGSGSVVNTTA